MPYMSYQDAERQKLIEQVIRNPDKSFEYTQNSAAGRRHDRIALADDAAEHSAVRGYMSDKHQSNLYSLRLQPRRTLDQSYYYMLKDTSRRDEDQVVSRWARKEYPDKESSHNILMVDQLWLWLIKSGDENKPDTIISCFPSRRGVDAKARQFDDIQASVLGRNTERIPISGSVDIISRILTLCCKTLDRHQSSESLQFLQHFESALARSEETGTELFSEFKKMTKELSSLNEKHVDYRQKRNELHSRLSDIQKDTELLEEVKDIQDEIKMIRIVTEDQLRVLKQIKEFPWAQKRRAVGYAEDCLKDTQRSLHSMQFQARSVEKEASDLLDLKQKQANLWEARLSREGAEENAKQGSTIFVFTVVTIVFDMYLVYFTDQEENPT
ncbi:hypothetical protein SLS58_009413 [Diplodia intermedia]|uniref:Uncharacterized protein n=1 Tax=Diplodia intermedia TaxID=856260 RepID=A0ABR3TCT0_9PEZI